MAKIKVKVVKKENVENTTSKQREHLKKIGFQPGQSGNPAGRPKGSRTKLGEAFLKDLMTAWEEGGLVALKRVRKDDPSTFVKVAASILPKELNINEKDKTLEEFLDQFKTVEEIDEFIKGITALGVAGPSDKEKATTKARSKSDVLH